MYLAKGNSTHKYGLDLKKHMKYIVCGAGLTHVCLQTCGIRVPEIKVDIVKEREKRET